MKKLYTLIMVSICFTSILSAQNWQLFPLNQKSYFQFEAGNEINIDAVFFDSLEIVGSEKTFYSRLKFNAQYASSCYDECQSSIYAYVGYQDFAFDTIREVNDTVFINDNLFNNTFYFLPHSQPGESWIINGYDSITITCISANVDTFLGITDSVKIFSLHEPSPVNDTIDNYVFRLSKAHGLIEFLPIVNFFYQNTSDPFTQYSLIGLEDSSGTAGFTLPVFHDYFPYAAGDVLLWNTHGSTSPPFPGWPYDEYDRDSIVAVYSFPDSISYICHNSHLDRFGVLTSSVDTVSYSRGSIGFFIESLPVSFTFNDGSFLLPGNPQYEIWESQILKVVPDTVTSTSQIERNYYWQGYSLDTINCIASGATDVYASVKINNHVGPIEFCNALMMSTICKCLTGARIGLLTYGDPILPTSIQANNFNRNNFKIYPNPATNFLSLQHDGAITSLKILNVQGQIVLEKNAEINLQQIDISTLAEGFYFLELSNNQSSITTKFFKLSN
jgi:hypothetical protein